MTVASPTPFQTSTSATESRAMDGSVSHPGPVRPKAPITSLMTPLVGFISAVKVMPTPTVLTSTGKNTTDRR